MCVFNPTHTSICECRAVYVCVFNPTHASICECRVVCVGVGALRHTLQPLLLQAPARCTLLTPAHGMRTQAVNVTIR